MVSERVVPDARERVRHLVAVIFRQRRTVIVSFLVLSTLATIAAYLQPVHYESRARLLVTRARADATVTTAQEGTAPNLTEVTDKELQSEAQILQSSDLLRAVVASCGLTERPGWLQQVLRPIQRTPAEPDVRLDRLVRELRQRFQVSVIEKSNLIQVTYAGAAPSEAYCALDTFVKDYVDKHLALKRPAGTLRFFQDASAGYRELLEAAESRLRDFGQSVGTGAVELQTELKVRELAEAEALLRETNAGIAELTERAQILQAQLNEIPERRTTQKRTADNAQLLERLQSTLLDLELERTALAARYQPDYLPLKDLERQIAQTRAAIASATTTPVIDEVTDRDPTHDWLRAELVRTRTEFAALEARASAAARTVAAYREEIRALSDRAIEHLDLERQAKAQEENYLLYLRKQEEARIAQALDSQGITNVVVAEAPNVPTIPTSLRVPVWLAGMGCAVVAALLLAFLVDSGDGSFRTPEEVHEELGLPVLAAFPRGAVPMSGPEKPS
jgi:uncharacterized protein involved in exopolysaccharide biosynthesis